MISLYSVADVSIMIQLSSGGGALLRNGSYGARDPSFASGGGGGVKIVGGSGAGYMRLCKSPSETGRIVVDEQQRVEDVDRSIDGGDGS